MTSYSSSPGKKGRDPERISGVLILISFANWNKMIRLIYENEIKYFRRSRSSSEPQIGFALVIVTRDVYYTLLQMTDISGPSIIRVDLNINSGNRHLHIAGHYRLLIRGKTKILIKSPQKQLPENIARAPYDN